MKISEWLSKQIDNIHLIYQLILIIIPYMVDPKMQRDMVTHVLQSTAGRFDDVDVDGGNGDACGVNATVPSEEEREEILLGYVRQLEHRVEDLRKEVEEEMAWNARLEKMLQERVIISDDEKKINSSHMSAGYS